MEIRFRESVLLVQMDGRFAAESLVRAFRRGSGGGADSSGSGYGFDRFSRGAGDFERRRIER